MAQVIAYLAMLLILIGGVSHLLDIFEPKRTFVVMQMLGLQNSQGWIVALVGAGLFIFTAVMSAVISGSDENKKE